MLRPKRILLVLLAVFFLVAIPTAQNKEKVKRLTPTHRGSTGLFNLFTADTLRQGEFSVSAAAHKFNRDPGDLDYTIFPLTFTVGLHNRIELFGSMEAYKRVNADDIIVNKILPGGPRQPARLASGDPGGTIGFFNESPFMDVGFGDGTGDLWTGLKFNLASERWGDQMGVAIQPRVKFHLTDDREHLQRGLTSGASDYGFDLILSKNLPNGGTFTGNAGFLFAEDLAGADRQNSFNWGGGFESPLGSPGVSVIGELLGSVYYGDAVSNFVNESDPIDAYLGLRGYPARWLALSAAANFHLTGTDVPGVDGADRVGFYVQAAFQHKINEPPAVDCSANPGTVTEGDSTTINASISDPDDDSLSVTWKSSAGRLSQSDSSATFDSSGLDPGRYSVMVEVTDGDTVASCSADIDVLKRKMAPTVSCEPSSSSVTMGESVTLQARASDPNGDDLTYAWAVDGQSVTNNRPSFEFGTAGRSVGRHTVRVTVTDVDSMSASCEYNVVVNRRPNNNPTCSLSLSDTEVYAGETVTGTARASDPDGDPITYSWMVDGQTRSGSASSLQINTAGMTGGSHSVTLSVADDRGGTCTDTKSFSVVEKIVIPINNVRPDNKAKAQLDEIALKMQQNPRLRARITGHTDDRGSEANNVRFGMRRAEAVKDYLVKQHNLDESRIETKSAGESSPIGDNSTAEGREQNRRVEVELFVP